jgi:orotidine 5'-phosphate decarboxylase subfamily 1/orotate phosphoribosyltransferase
MTKEDFIVKLYEIGALKFGSFTLKSGITSPFYVDVRQIISHPALLRELGILLDKLCPVDLKYDRAVGVPYAGIPIASALTMQNGKPLIIPRKEEKAYGSGSNIIGQYFAGDSVLIVEDVITSGESILETKAQLEEVGLKVTAAIVVIDRRAIRNDFAAQTGIRLLSLITIEEVVAVLMTRGFLSSEQARTIQMFLMNTMVGNERPTDIVYKNDLTKQLVARIQEKESRVVLSLDVDSTKEFWSILKSASKHIVMLKTHIDTLEDYSPAFVSEVRQYCNENNIFLFEDRKFADIGNTVRAQYRGGIYKIADWADFVTVHMISGEAILNGLFDGLSNRSSFLLAKMSSKDNLISESYTRKVIELGKKNEPVVSGFIGHGKTAGEILKLRKKIPANFLLLMPGVQIASTGDSLGQTYIDPATATRNGADAIIVGRGITHAKDIEKAAETYRVQAQNGWNNK